MQVNTLRMLPAIVGIHRAQEAPAGDVHATAGAKVVAPDVAEDAAIAARRWPQPCWALTGAGAEVAW